MYTRVLWGFQKFESLFRTSGDICLGLQNKTDEETVGIVIAIKID